MIPVQSLISRSRVTPALFACAALILAATVRADTTAPSQAPSTDEPTPKTTRPEIVDLLPYRVQGYDQSRYGSDVSTSATRIETPHENLPLVVNVVSRHLLDEQQAVDPSDAFKNLSSVDARVATPGQSNQVAIRGFNSFTYIDGFRVGNSNSNGLGAVSFATEVANIERIEVLKGPAATLYGRGLPGGVINYVTKKPQPEASSSLTGQVGSYNFYRAVADTTGPITEDHQWQYRVIGSTSGANSYRDQVEQSSAALYPSVSRQISDTTTLLLRSEYQYIDYTPDQGALFLPDGSLAGASSRRFFYGSPDDSIQAEQYGVNAQLETETSPTYTLRTLLGARRVEQSGTATLGIDLDGNELERVIETTDDRRDDYLVQIDNVFRFDQSLFNLPLEHQLLVTADLQHNRVAPTSTQASLERLNVDTGERAGPSTSAGSPTNYFFISEDIGFGVQDLIEINERTHLLLGIRYDRSTLDFDLDPFPFEGEVSLDNWSYRTGVIHRLSDPLSVFVNYGTAYQPSLRFNDAGESLFDLQQSVQYEGGVKTDLYYGRLTLTTAIFHLTNEDVIIVDSAGTPVKTNQGSHGAEMDLTTRLTERTTLLFNFSAIATEYTNGPFAGNEIFGAPRHSGGVWINQDLIAETNKRLSLNFGFNYVGSSYATDANNAKLPPAHLLTTGLQYVDGPWHFRLNVFNLLGETGYVPSPNENVGSPTAPIYALPIAPTTARMALTYIF